MARYSSGAEVRLREEASASYLKHAPLERFRVIHFATHAVVDERSVSRTVLALAPGGGESGLIGPGDLAALRLDADLVVLSGCRTAGGVVVEGEGVQGLTAPLIQAGTRSVVASQWRIGDRSTIAFIQDFYQALAAGHAGRRRTPRGEARRAPSRRSAEGMGGIHDRGRPAGARPARGAMAQSVAIGRAGGRRAGARRGKHRDSARPQGNRRDVGHCSVGSGRQGSIDSS